MFYDCGWLNDYRYIYDTSDDTCELVDLYRLSKNEIYTTTMEPQACLMKLAVAYNFSHDTLGLKKKVCNYAASFTDNVKLTVNLDLRLLPIGEYCYYGGSSDTHSDVVNTIRYLTYDSGKHDSFMIYLCFSPSATVPNTSVYFRYTPELRLIVSKFNNIRLTGLPIPVQMLTTIERLKRKMDISALDKALGGALFTNLKLRSLSASNENGEYTGKLDFVNWGR